MEEQKKIEEGKSRRAFVKTAAQVAVTAPAVAMLLSATTKPAAAQAAGYSTGPGLFDDTLQQDCGGGTFFDCFGQTT